MKQDLIKIDYPGDCISVNHYLGRRRGGGYYVKQEARDWMEEFQWLLKRCHIVDYKLPLEIICSGYFKDERSAPDLSNLSKVILDSIEEVTGINDQAFRWRDGKRIIGVKEPFLLITIKEGDTKPISDALQSMRKLLKIKSNGKLHAKKINKKN